MDEIGELDLAMQSKLLRVLESGEIRRVGGTKYRKIDVRIISATNRDLKKMVAEGTFREDLYYRLSVIPIIVPPLRERKEDIEGLALYFLEKLNKKYLRTKQFTESAIQALADYDWPGNVRELRNVVERVFVVTSENVISAGQVGNILGGNHREKQAAAGLQGHLSLLEQGKTLKDATEAFQKQLILEALQQNGGNVENTAKALGLGRSGLYKKMDKLGLKRQF